MIIRKALKEPCGLFFLLFLLFLAYLLLISEKMTNFAANS